MNDLIQMQLLQPFPFQVVWADSKLTQPVVAQVQSWLQRKSWERVLINSGGHIPNPKHVQVNKVLISFAHCLCCSPWWCWIHYMSGWEWCEKSLKRITWELLTYYGMKLATLLCANISAYNRKEGFRGKNKRVFQVGKKKKKRIGCSSGKTKFFGKICDLE